MAEYQPKYNSARAVYRERKKYVEEIDWNMLVVPPSGSSKEEVQWIAWKKLLSFEKGNPQRIDNASASKQIVFAYEQCLMYLYHYPDIWYDYAMWHEKSGSRDSAVAMILGIDEEKGPQLFKCVPAGHFFGHKVDEMLHP